MTTRDPIAARRAELERRLAALSPEQKAKLAASGPAVLDVQRTVPARDPESPIPMSFAQELLWRLERASPGHAYNVPRSVRLRGALDLGALQRALDALVVRHEALRTTFALVQDEPRQIVNAAVPVVITRVDLSSLPVEQLEAAARRTMKELASVRFDLEMDLQLHAAVIRLADDDNVLQLLSHHVASDGWSGNILTRELAALYEGFKTGTPVALAPLPVQFADYAAWQRRVLSGERLASLLAYWRDQLAGAPSHLDLPTDRTRPSAPSFDGAIRGTTLPFAVVDGMRAVTRGQGLTSFMVLLSALYVLLSRYTGEEELVVGTPIAGRPHPELEGIVGFFTNTLLLRGSLAGNPTFRELLDRVRASCLGAFDHQEIPLETLLLAKGSDGRPLVAMPQVVLSTEDPDREKLRLSGTASTPMAAALGGTKFDLTIWAAERPEGMRVAAEFRTDLFDDATIDRLLRHFGVLLQAAVASPDTRVGDLPIIDHDERRQVLLDWNDTRVVWPTEGTLSGLLAAQAARTPNATAVEDERCALTYAELDARALALAHRLRALGVGRGVLVGVCAERSVEMVVALVAIVKAGAAYVPLDPEYPRDRLAFMLEDAATPVILAQHRTASVLPTHGAAIVWLDDVATATSSNLATAEPIVGPEPDDAAYMIYTSGSTGRPKGAINSHRGIVNRLLWMQAEYQLGPADVVLQKTPFSFDVSVWEFFWPLLSGAKLVMARPGGHRDTTYLVDVVTSRGVTVCHFVPSMLRAFLSDAATARCTTVRDVIASGEALPPDLVSAFYAALPGARLHNLYGPTECAVDVSYWPCPPSTIAPAVVPIGRPVANTQLYILDAHGAPSPIGVPGELYLAGVQVGIGYHNRPELTGEKFVPNSFALTPGARMYRTGDRARWRTDGTVEYLGRLDFQVKVRGFRIELGEIESVLLALPGVAEAVVIVREETRGDQRIVAYVVAQGDALLTIPTLRDGMRERLPEMMIPSAIEFLERLPLTSSGKIDRRALPVPHGGVSGPPYQSPRTTIEHEIVQIWEKLLSPGRPIGALDDFFEIGGHSLLAMQMLAELERVRGQRVPLAWLFESSTVESLAEKLGAKLLDAKEPPLVVLQEQGRDRPIVFVHGDWTGGGWYARRLAPLVAPESPFFVLPTIGADGEILPWTIEAMAARHLEELRKVQPHGPYRLVGFCVGGVIAFEMGRQLLAAGDVIERLIVIDSDPVNARLQSARRILSLLPPGEPNARLSRSASVMSRLRWVDRRVRYVRAMPLADRVRWVGDKVTRRLPRLLRRATPAAQSAGTTATLDAMDGDEAIVLRMQVRATSAYIPSPFKGVVDFIWARGAPDKSPRPNPFERWQLIATRVRLHALPSGHIGLITNNLPLLAAALRAALTEE